jgi:hypothetical protein
MVQKPLRVLGHVKKAPLPASDKRPAPATKVTQQISFAERVKRGSGTIQNGHKLKSPQAPITGFDLAKLVTGLLLNGGIHQTPLPGFSNFDVSRALGNACDLIFNHVGIDISEEPLADRTQEWYSRTFGGSVTGGQGADFRGGKPNYITRPSVSYCISPCGNAMETTV